MNQAYKTIQDQAQRLHQRTQTTIDDKNKPEADAVIDLAQDVLDTIEGDRPPRSIEEVIKRLQQSLQRLKAAPSDVMSPLEAGNLLSEYEHLRRDVQALPNY